MEKRTHILFTITGIYGLNLLFKYLGLNTGYFYIYILLVSSFPLITIPFQSIVTSLPDVDLPNSRLKKTVLAPAVIFISLFAKHRGFTHRLEGIYIVGILLYLLHLLGTNIIIVGIISFLAISIIWVLIDDFKLKIFGLEFNKIGIGRFSVPVDKKLIEKTFTLIILLFFPVLLNSETYTLFLIGLFFSYIFHMFGDMFSKGGWTLIELPNTISKRIWFKKIKIELPDFLSFKVGGKIERKIIKPLLLICLIGILILDRDFFIQKAIHDIKLSMYQASEIINNPELLYNDLNSIKIKVDNILGYVKDF